MKEGTILVGDANFSVPEVRDSQNPTPESTEKHHVSPSVQQAGSGQIITGKVWDYELVRARCHELCKLKDGSPCTGPETDCTPETCYTMQQAAREFGYNV